MNSFDIFIYFIVAIKIVFVIASLAHRYFTHRGSKSKNAKLDPQFEYWRERTEFIFTGSMAVLLLITFNPWTKNRAISRETSILFYLFGWILLITAKWSDFFHEAGWFKQIQAAISK